MLHQEIHSAKQTPHHFRYWFLSPENGPVSHRTRALSKKKRQSKTKKFISRTRFQPLPTTKQRNSKTTSQRRKRRRRRSPFSLSPSTVIKEKELLDTGNELLRPFCRLFFSLFLSSTQSSSEMPELPQTKSAICVQSFGCSACLHVTSRIGFCSVLLRVENQEIH